VPGTILASERRSQSHHHSFQEGQPQSHCTGFPTGEGAPEGERGKRGGNNGERWREVRACLCECVREARVYGGRDESSEIRK